MHPKAKIQPLHALMPQQLFTFVGDTKIYEYVKKEFEAIIIRDLSGRTHLMYNLLLDVKPLTEDDI